MRTWNRVCIEDYAVEAQNGDRLELQRGKEYLTSDIANGSVVVFSSFWERVPARIFAGEQQFTRER